jgi:hypothetical protein
MSPSDPASTEITTHLPPQEVWRRLDAQQQQHVFQTLVQLCRQLLQTARPQPEMPEVDHA